MRSPTPPPITTTCARSRFGVTAKRAGWDALRHYEIAAAGAVPCFRDLDRKPATCAPVRARPRPTRSPTADADDLLAAGGRARRRPRYARLQAGALEWARANTTVVRAREFLRACGMEPA